MADYFVFITGSHAHSVYDRHAIQAEAGMHMNVFSKVHYDRVYFWYAEGFVTGSGFDPPAAPPYPVEKSSAPPPPPEYM